ncbi:helix-turn-helix domain-containing protein [Streptomyces sp. NBC_01240]|uniref:helix-turn-helix domain-containing protein n=1 Tax=Streptomyces sp. NBC_01240 TaxID=2903793 RepID=UPI002E0E680D|nr:helix-turn-helix domain-containing protein [Streptomyces sp. NBC_01240]
MRIRADVAELIHQGFNNAYIKQRCGVSGQHVAAARRRLQRPDAPERRDATALERLYAEAVPTGRVYDYQPPAGRMPLSPAQQAANRATLLAALRGEAA